MDLGPLAKGEWPCPHFQNLRLPGTILVCSTYHGSLHSFRKEEGQKTSQFYDFNCTELTIFTRVYHISLLHFDYKFREVKFATFEIKWSVFPKEQARTNIIRKLMNVMIESQT